jgi:preprotein translocase subunit SecF
MFVCSESAADFIQCLYISLQYIYIYIYVYIVFVYCIRISLNAGLSLHSDTAIPAPITSHFCSDI